MTKAFVYDSGIKRTHWKSTMNEKLNPLRGALLLPPRDIALREGQYDKQAVTTLRATDFSELDNGVVQSWFCIIGLSNTLKHVVLGYAGYGLVDVDSQIAGDVHPHAD